MVQLLPAGYPSQATTAGQGHWKEYEWIVVCGALAAFFMAWGIGANDVANSFGTSVGSKALKLWQACIIAGIFEFLGAMVLGGEVTKTIASDIARTEAFNNNPEIYMYGMLTALTAASIWLLIATYSYLAVSTTHSIIGAIIGFAFVYGGSDAVKWNDCKPDFPWSNGVVPVVCSWFVSPICSGILSSILFFLTRTLILRRKNSTQLAFWTLPFLLFLTFFINIMFVLSKGAKKDMEKHYPPKSKWSTHCTKALASDKIHYGQSYKDYTDLNNAAAWIGAVCGAGVAVIGGAIGIPLMKRRYQRDLEEEKQIESGEKAATEAVPAKTVPEPELEKSKNPAVQLWYIAKFLGLKLYAQVIRGLYFDVHQNVAKDQAVSSIHEAAEVFDPHTEQVFKYMQVFSACCVSFAHGSNDVANSVGPFAGIWFVYNYWQVPGSNAETPKWIFALGGLGLVVGLMTYGYKIIMELGVTLLKLTPSRGYCAELATGMTISLASAYGLPVSTTQIIVGAETGVGLVESVKTGVNFPVLIKTFMGWVFTIIIAALTCAAIFAMGVYAPSVMMADDIRAYQLGISNTTENLLAVLANANKQYNFTLVDPTDSSSRWWTIANVKTTGNQVNGKDLQSAIDTARKNNALLFQIKKDSKSHYYVDPEFAIYWLNRTVNLYKNVSAVTVGQNYTAFKSSSLWNNAAPAPPPPATGRR